ncbi:MAG: AmmeMemoRadiSam system protein A [Sulfurimonas sp.]|uniref:AmmeMemoRadiSam system protein A n=1 Tax=Sulfurimonas sp. TaxID=2022749 RepID=UPI00262D2A54|nr:AmmeMemoRadiSam system protein A [Sulfurimonas sp.]MCW8895657.1 AmmeMemoRadiSam system protein A [Sulfurimonas sp.]MCW8954198.1 AmmeMemoRadiSam system protein A [Sulfurimonas sp.]MCW9066909.1 AmmeMemoRadiSam system protein A [Sulfurimonas sp.]
MLDSVLLRIAKSAILSRLDDSYSFDKEKLLDEYPFLKKEGAAFVTLKCNNDLRGCIGSVVAYRILLDDVISNAVSAGFSDPRFQPLTADELPYLTLEVSVLSEPEILEYEGFEDLCKKITPHVDGLILKHEIYQGTFLPQVWKQLPTPKLFLEHLSMKAGSSLAIYEEHPTIYRYSVDAIEEDFDEVLPL